MKVSEYGKMVASLVKPGQDILDALTAEQVDLWHMGTGVAGEAGELLDAIKKYVVYQNGLDFENVVEEMGDIEFYLEKIRQNLGLDRDKILLHNMNKLSGKGGRYADGGYSDEQAKNRRDKA